MTADTYSARLGLIKQGTGNNNNSWGDTFNASFADIVDRAIAGIVTHTDTGGTLDLSGSPPPAGPSGALEMIHRFTGALASNLTVQMPNLSKAWIIDNSTSNAFQLFIKTAAGTAVQVPQGSVRWIFCDGANGMKREDADNIGVIQMSGKAAVGAGELACNGASLLRTDYPDLFAKIGTTWGTVDGLHFTLPDFATNNRFPRAAGGALAVGATQSNQNKAHTHAISGIPGNGTLTVDAGGAHTPSGTNGTVTVTSTRSDVCLGAVFQGTGPSNGGFVVSTGSLTSTGAGPTFTGNAVAAHTHTVSGALTAGTLATVTDGGTEARPESAVVLFGIRY